MKTDLSTYEIKKILKKFEKHSKIKTIVYVAVGLAIIFAIVMFVLSKVNKGKCPVSYDGLDLDDYDDLDYCDYDDDMDMDYDDVPYDYYQEDEDEAEEETDEE